MDWWIVAMALGQLVFVGWVLWIIAYYKVNRAKVRTDERLRVLEQFGSGRELAEFLGSGSGDKLIEAFVPKASNPRTPIVTGVAAGLISLSLGFAFLILAWLEVFGDPEVFLIPGVLLSFAGIGILVATAVSLQLLRTKLATREEDEKR